MKKKQAIAKPEAVAPLAKYVIHVVGKVSAFHKFVVEAESEFQAEEIALKRAEEISDAINWDLNDGVDDFDVNESFEADEDDAEDRVYAVHKTSYDDATRAVIHADEYPAWYKGPKKEEES